MLENKTELACSPEGFEAKDAITEVVRAGAQKLIYQAVETELEALLANFSNVLTLNGTQAVVRNGYLPERKIQTGIGDVSVKIPKVRDRSGQGIKFNSSIVPPYLKRSKSFEELLPALYLYGISTGNFSEALRALLGEEVNLSPGLISRLKAKWEKEHKEWRRRSLEGKKYVYFWADGLFFNVRGDNDKQCILVIIGAREDGVKELVGLLDGYRESEASWTELLLDLKKQGLEAPNLAVGDGALGFWKALSKEFPETQHQRCWVHKTANVLNKLPKTQHSKTKQGIHDIYNSENKKDAIKEFDHLVAKLAIKYPKASECLAKDKTELLAFYNFPAEHWCHLRTTNPIESTFATVRLRTAKTRNCVSRETILAMVFKLTRSAEKGWRKLNGAEQLPKVVMGIKFVDGIEEETQEETGKVAA